MKNGLTREEKKWEKQLLLEISLQNHCVVYTFQWKISWPANVSFRYFLVMAMGTWQNEDFLKLVSVVIHKFQIVGGILENENARLFFRTWLRDQKKNKVEQTNM